MKNRFIIFRGMSILGKWIEEPAGGFGSRTYYRQYQFNSDYLFWALARESHAISMAVEETTCILFV
jgi:hypothetical protein